MQGPMHGNHRRGGARLALVGLLACAGVMAGSLAEHPQEPLHAHGHVAEPLTDIAADDVADIDDGRALSCAEWARKVNRLQRLVARRQRGPAPDLADVAYGEQALQTLDVYQARSALSPGGAPIIVMVHGGGWCVGDKRSAKITTNKVARWGAKGFTFVSLNYPMVNEGADALAQAHHVARAVAYVQSHARQWGADPAKLVLVGHSAGAHLVSLVNADAQIRRQNGVGAILGAISLDAGAIDVVAQMPRVYPFLRQRYREAFGDSAAQWRAASPLHRLGRDASPWLGVCSTQRKDDPCEQANRYAEKSRHLDIRASVLPQAKSHAELNADLGLPGSYTEAVEAFMATLDPTLAQRLSH